MTIVLFIILTLNTKYVTCMDPVTLDLVTPSKQYGEFCGYESCPMVKPGMINVHIVPHTYAGFGYSRTFYQHYTGYDDLYDQSNINMKRILDFTITELWSDSNRKFTLGDMPYFFHWWSQRDSTVRRMVYQLLRQGRLYFVGGAWGMPDEATTNYHALIDTFTYTLRKINATFLECGRPLVAWQSQVYGHSREFASLMAHMGFDGLFLSPIGMDDEIQRMQRQALEFLWRGSDDLGPESDIYTHKLFDGYDSPPGFCFSTLCTDPLLIASDSLFRNTDERAKVFIEQILHRQAPGYNTSNVMVMMGATFGYFDANLWFKNIEKLIGAVNEQSAKMNKKIHLMYSTPACYLRAVHVASPLLETKQDDFLPFLYDKNSYMAGMYTSRPSIKLLAREGHVYLQIAKQVQVLAKLWNNDKIFEEFFWIMGVFQDHDIISGAMKQSVKDYYVEKMYVAVQKSTLILKQAFNKLRRSPSGTLYFRCYFNESRCENTNRNRELFIIIYNPLAWPVSLPVRLPVKKYLYNVYDASGAKIKVALMKIAYPLLSLPSLNTADHELIFIAENIPPLGYRSYYIERFKLTKRKRSLIKKLKKQNKKYLIRQINNPKTDDSLLSEMDKSDYSFTDAEINPELLILSKKYKDLVNRTKSLIRNKDDMDYSEFHATTENTVDNSQIEDVKSKDPQEYIEELERKSFDITKNFTRKLIPLNFSDNMNETDTAYDYVDILPTRRFIQDGTQKEDNIIEDIPKPEEPVFDQKSEEMQKKQADLQKTLQEGNRTLNDTEELDETRRNLEERNRTLNDTEEPEDQRPEETRRKLEEISRTLNDTEEPEDQRPEETIRKLEGNRTLNETEIEPQDTEQILVETRRKSGETQKENDEEPQTTTEPVNNYQQPEESKQDEMEGKLKDSRRRLDEETRLYVKDYLYNESSDLHIQNKYIRVNLDPSSRKVASVSLSNGVAMSLDIQLYYLAADAPEALGRPRDQPPGVYVLRSIDNVPVTVLDYLDAQIYKNKIVEEVHYRYSDWASLVLRVYAESPVIEVDWMVGPIPVDDGVGKDVFIRYMTDLVHGGVFYTDSNGRQTIKRIRNTRPLYQPINADKIAGNYYPVTSKIHIEDLAKNIRFSIFPDRTQGATSLYDGELDLMVHRRLLTQDLSFEVSLNETYNKEGIRIRGKHYLYLSKGDFKPNKIFEKKFARELSMPPQVLLSRGWPYGLDSKQIWSEHNNEYSFLNKKLPVGIHVLTVEKWNGDTLLLRLENYLEKTDAVKSGVKTVFIKDLFKNLVINSVRETTLAANIWLKDFLPLQWKKRENFFKSFNHFYGNYTKNHEYSDDKLKPVEEVNLDNGIRFAPQQIRTFVCWFKYAENF